MIELSKVQLLRLLVSCGAFLVLLGCSGGPGRIATPQIDPDDIAEAVLELYDKNSDGTLDQSELSACPSLANASDAYDKNNDAMLSETEIVDGISSWAQRGIGAMALPFTVLLDGKPLEGAEVKLEPAQFLAGMIQPASGVSDRTGSGSLQMAADSRPSNMPAHLPVMQPGLYEVVITHPTITIPERYNVSTTLGVEAGLAGQNPYGARWELSSKKN